jgi:hypothetical protein
MIELGPAIALLASLRRLVLLVTDPILDYVWERKHILQGRGGLR